MEKELFVVLDNLANIVEFRDPSNITGYRENEIINKNWFDVFIHYVDKQEIMTVFTGLLTNEAPHWTYDNRIICKNGEEKLLHFNNHKIPSPSNELTFIAFTALEASYQFLRVEDL